MCVSAGDVMSPVGGDPPPATGGTALGWETPALWPRPGHPWGTPAASQTQTAGPPPRRGGSGVVKLDRNGTGRGMEEMSSVALGLVAGQRTASRTPGTIPSSPPRTMKGLLDTSGWSARNSSMETSFWPTPSEGPTDHMEWHASVPTWNTPAPPGPTEPRDLDPGPSVPPDLLSARPAESLKLAACGECLGWRVLGHVGPEAPTQWELSSSGWQRLPHHGVKDLCEESGVWLTVRPGQAGHGTAASLPVASVLLGWKPGPRVFSRPLLPVPKASSHPEQKQEVRHWEDCVGEGACVLSSTVGHPPEVLDTLTSPHLPLSTVSLSPVRSPTVALTPYRGLSPLPRSWGSPVGDSPV